METREEFEVHRSVVNALAQDIDHAALSNLRRKPREELEATDVLRVARVDHSKVIKGIRLCGSQEGEELDHVDRVGPVIVLCAPCEVARSISVRRRPWRARGIAGRRRRSYADDRVSSPFC